MMRPNALEGNDRIGLMKLNKSNFSSLLIASEDFPLSTAAVTFGGRCARELFLCYS